MHKSRIGAFGALLGAGLFWIMAVVFGIVFKGFLAIILAILGLPFFIIGIIFLIKHRKYIQYCKETIRYGEIFEAKIIRDGMRQWVTGEYFCIFEVTFKFQCEGTTITRTLKFDAAAEYYHHVNRGYVKVCYDKHYNRIVYIR